MRQPDDVDRNGIASSTCSRRRFLTTISSAALGLVAAACAPQAPPAQQAPAAPKAEPKTEAKPAPKTEAPAAAKTEAKPAQPAAGAIPADVPGSGTQPRPGGILTIALQGDPPSLDLHQVETQLALYPIAPVVNYLVQYDPYDGTTIIPDLAER